MTINPLLKRINNGQVLTLDGAVGTEIEKLHIIQNPQLWSSDALVNHPAVIEQIHQRYLAAGADIIETATYQANPHFLDAQGVDGAALVDRAINLAQAAVATSHRSVRPLVAGTDVHLTTVVSIPVNITVPIKNFRTIMPPAWTCSPTGSTFWR